MSSPEGNLSDSTARAIDQFLGEQLRGHAGSVAHSMAYAGGLADRGLGVALAVNTTDVRIGTYGRGVLAIAADQSPVETVPGLALQEKLDAVTGTYEGYRGPTATVETDGGHLAVTLTLEGHDDSMTAVPVSSAPDDKSFYPLRRDSVTRHDTISGVSGRDTGVLRAQVLIESRRSGYAVRDDGRRESIEFRETDDGLVLLLAGLRLNRQ